MLKLAASLDGRTAAPDRTSRWITGEAARADAHRLRAESDAVLVGAGTVRADDPELTVRHVAGRDPLRVVLGQAPPGARVHPCVEMDGDLGDVLDDLGARDVLQVLVEGGAGVAGAFHRAGLVDHYVVYLAPVLFGGDDAPGLFSGAGAATMSDVWRGRISPRDTPGRRHPRRPEATGSEVGMFTGIVEELGAIDAIDAGRVRVAATTVLDGARQGDSIAVDGCCLTLVAQGAGWWEADVSDETLKRTTLGDRQPGDRVNLERPVRAQDRLGGHIVQGHVDGVGEIVEPVPDLRVRMPRELLRYVVEKGSIAVDGVSLTVVDVLDDGFTVAVIPHTADVTTLGHKGPGERVNLEVDVTVKYVERLLTWNTGTAPAAAREDS